MPKKKFTIGELVDAIEKDGLKQAFGALFKSPDDRYIHQQTTRAKSLRDNTTDKTSKIGMACALGQGYINISVNPLSIDLVNQDYSNVEKWSIVRNFITTSNDKHHMSLATIAQLVRREYSEAMDVELVGIEFDYTDHIAPEAYVKGEA